MKYRLPMQVVSSVGIGQLVGPALPARSDEQRLDHPCRLLVPICDAFLPVRRVCDRPYNDATIRKTRFFCMQCMRSGHMLTAR